MPSAREVVDAGPNVLGLEVRCRPGSRTRIAEMDDLTVILGSDQADEA